MQQTDSLMSLELRFPIASLGDNVCILQGALERVDDGEGRLMQVCQEGEKLLLHLPKATAGQVQQNLSSIQQDWDSYVEQCRLNQQNLEESATLLSR